MLFDPNELPNLPVYDWERERKQAFLNTELAELTAFHRQRCPEYARIAEGWAMDGLPFLPVRLFKEYSLKSVPQEALHRTMTSSGTTGQQVSRIFLDRETSALQSRVSGQAAPAHDYSGYQRRYQKPCHVQRPWSGHFGLQPVWPG